MPDARLPSKFKIPQVLLALLIIAYTGYFSWYTINRHNTLNSYAADLSLIDQPMWNTVIGPGGFMEQTWGNRQQPRLAEHFEPILVPLAFLFFIWDDVRILLIAQSLALSLGAIPVFWIAHYQFSQLLPQLPTSQSPNFQSPISPHPAQFPILPSSIPILNPLITFINSQFFILNSKFSILNSPTPAWVALVFAAIYLMFPHLQAANIADFHADPFIVTPLLFAFWYATQKRWRWLWFWAIIAMLTKETLPTLIAMLGLYLLLDHFRSQQTKSSIANSISTPPPRSSTANPQSPVSSLQSPVSNLQSPPSQFSILNSQFSHALALILVSTIWFLIATFLIVDPLARQYFGSDGPIYLANRFSEDISLSYIIQDPARWQYLLGLFVAVGFLPLLAPELLLLGLPVLAANLLSNFPGQYSGEQHYSAPLVVAFIVAAIYGSRRLIDRFSLHESKQRSYKITALLALLLWLCGWSISYHTLHGWTPLSIRAESYQPSAATRQLTNFIDQIPAEAIVSASPGLHPHIAHRRVAYVFPTIEEAEYLLIDVTDISGVHPNDVYSTIEQLLDSNWQLLQANHGLILAQKSSLLATATAVTLSCHQTKLPCSFFDFAHAATPPTYPLALTFGDGRLELLGYDVLDDADDGVVFRFHWRAISPLPDELKLWPLIYDDTGQLLSNPTQVPMIATVWYPPSAWPSNSVIVTETLPQLLPDSFHLGVSVGPPPSFDNPTQRYPIASYTNQSLLQPGNWVQLASFIRQGPFLTHLSPQPILKSLSPIQAQFGPAIQLTGYQFDQNDNSLMVLLKWITAEPLPTNFTVFVHLLASDGTLISQSDAFPTWLTPQPTSQWPPRQPLLDRHHLTLPNDLAAGTYSLQLGLYNAETLERLPLPDGTNALELDQIRLE